MLPRPAIKSISLGFAVIIALLFGLVHLLEISLQQSITLLLASVFIVAGIAIMALIVVISIILLLKLYRRLKN